VPTCLTHNSVTHCEPYRRCAECAFGLEDELTGTCGGGEEQIAATCIGLAAPKFATKPTYSACMAAVLQDECSL